MISTKDFNFPPSFIGFDYLRDELDRAFPEEKFPKHNLIKVDDERMYLEMALAGYSDKDITVDVEENLITVKSDKVEDEKKFWLVKGDQLKFHCKFETCQVCMNYNKTKNY